MFFYNNNYPHNLAQYGIEVPLLNTRVEKIKEIIDPQLIQDGGEFNPELLSLVHNNDFIDSLLNHTEEELIKTFELKNPDGSYNRYNPDRAEFPLAKLLESIFAQTQGTIAASELALKNGFAFNLGGGQHHAMTFGGRGFCQVNDLVIAIRKLQKVRRITHAWVIDVDAHKGDGTAEITQNDDSITTLSIHMAKGWPLDEGSKSEPWFIPSTIDIPVLPEEADQYVSLLESGLKELDRDFPRADLVIVNQGSDPYEKDELPSTNPLNLTAEQMLERDLLVYNFLKERNIPQAYVISGGYGRFAHEPYIQFLNKVL
jgi:acetoin utilization deacetylase AcuC-like enzyme